MPDNPAIAKQVAAIQEFNNLDASQWFLRKELVKDDKKRIYVRHNSRRPRPYKFRMSKDETRGILEQAAFEVKRDWNDNLRKFHPGFSSFSNTVGTYNSDDQVGVWCGHTNMRAGQEGEFGDM